MTKQETYDYLRARGVAFEITEHPAVFNMEAGDVFLISARSLFTST